MLKYIDSELLKGSWIIHSADYSHLRSIIERHPLEEQRILDEMAPCHSMEHRGGRCPLGDSHGMQVVEGSNTVVNVLRASIVNQIINTAADSLAITYVATGTSAAATVPASTTLLTAETYRAVPSSVIAGSPAATQALTFWFFGTGVANAGSDLQEWGGFAVGATGSANSGKCLWRFLQDYAKNTLNTASGQHTLNIG